MSKEEAIKQLKELIEHLKNDMYADDKKALEMAIQALEQEPCIYDLKNRYCPRLNEHGMLKYPLQEQTTPMSTFDIAKQFGIKLEPCDDAVSRDDRLLDLANAIDSDESGYWTNKRISSALRNISSIVEDLPPVTQKSKTGHWTRELIRNEKGGCIGAKMICSRCGNDNKHDEYMSYCPNCGVRMEREEQIEESIKQEEYDKAYDDYLALVNADINPRMVEP